MRVKSVFPLVRGAPWARRLGGGALLAAALLAAALLSTARAAGPVEVRLPMTCTRGPSTQWFSAVVTMPGEVQAGATATVRIDSRYSGVIKHFGLHYIYGMTTDYGIAPGATYVEDSLRFVKDSGTPNVRAGARAWHDAAGIHVTLPARVENGASYIPPSIEFELRADAAPAGGFSVEFTHYEVTASVFLLGDLHTACTPAARPSTIGATRVEAPAPQAKPAGVGPP